MSSNMGLFTYLPLLVFVAWSAAVNPGVKVRVTKRGMDYAKQLADAEIAKRLKVLSVKDMTGKDGKISWELKQVRIKSVTHPTTSYSLEPSKTGMTWSLKNFGISAKAGHWRVKYKKGWIKLSTSGSVDIKFSRVDLTQTASFGMDNTGRPSISSSGCSAHIGDLDLHFHGGIGFILNLFDGVIEKKLKKIIQPRICDLLKDYINVDARRELAEMKITTDVAKKFLLDYRLVAPPKVMSNYLEIWDKGEISWKGDNQASPFQPDPITPLTSNTKMVYIWITDYTPNTFLHQAHEHGYLSYDITEEDLSSSIAPYLSTTCDDAACIGAEIPEIGERYPNSTIELSIQTASAPQTVANSSTLTFKVAFTVELRVRKPDDSVENLIGLGMDLSLTVNAAIKDAKLSGEVVDHSFELSVIGSAFSDVDLQSTKFHSLLDAILAEMIVPQANALLSDGVELPVLKHIQFYNTILQLQEGNILIGTDVKYT